MMKSLRRCFPLLLLLSLHARWAFGAPGDASGEEKNVEAVEFGRTGLESYRLGDWTRAHEAFEKAERISHSPVFVLYMARSKRNQGELLAARQLYARARENVPNTSPEPWLRAATEAEHELAELASRIPSLVLSVEGARADTVEVTLDGEPAALGVEIELDPGSHRLLARSKDGASAEKTIVVVEKQRRVLQSIRLAPSVATAPVSPAHPQQHPPPPRSDEKPQGTNVAGYVAGGIGLAGLALGAATGLVALLKTNDVKERCEDNRCPKDEEPNARTAKTYADISTVGFVVGGAGLATSAVLFWVAPGRPAESARAIRLERLAFGVKTVF